MLKNIFLISIIVFSLFLIKTFDITSTKITSNTLSQSVKPIELPIAKLSIDKINVNNYIYKLNSENNTVEKNVELLNGSIMPGGENSIIFLAAHSGNSNISYFNNLSKLIKGDEINLYYKNKNYTYIVNDIFLEDKDGDIEINRSSNNQLILTTCSTTDINKQLIVNSNLKKIEVNN